MQGGSARLTDCPTKTLSARGEAMWDAALCTCTSFHKVLTRDVQTFLSFDPAFLPLCASQGLLQSVASLPELPKLIELRRARIQVYVSPLMRGRLKNPSETHGFGLFVNSDGAILIKGIDETERMIWQKGHEWSRKVYVLISSKI